MIHRAESCLTVPAFACTLQIVANRTRTLVDTALEIHESMGCDVDTALALAVTECTRRYGVLAQQSIDLGRCVLRTAVKRRALASEIAHVVDRSANMRRQVQGGRTDA